jgi:hypothetical protein
MHLTANFQVPKVDFEKYRQVLHERLSQAITDGAREWLTSVLRESTAVGMPVWSAASMSTFAPLASQVNYAIALSPVSGVSSRVDVGIGASSSNNGVFEWGETPGHYSFTYSTGLEHLIVNEYNNANAYINPNTGSPYFHLTNPGPYHFQEKGEKAFRQSVSEIALPGWDAILSVTSLVVG